MSELLIAPVVLLLGLLGVAVVSDLRSHRIPNLLVLLGLVLGVVGQTYAFGLIGLGHALLGLLVGALAPALPASLNVEVLGELASEDVEILKLSAMRGLFSAVIEDQVTFVNAPALAAERGVEAVLTSETESPNHRSVVDVRAVAADGSVVNVSGTLSGPQLVEKIVQINGRNLDLRAEGINLILNYGDQPGALGKIGTLLGAAEVNILAAQLSQDADGSGATIMLRLDREVPADVLGAIGEAVGATTLELVDLS